MSVTLGRVVCRHSAVLVNLPGCRKEVILLRSLVSLSVFLIFTAFACAQAPVVGNCIILPADNIWNTRIDQLSVHSSSSTWTSTIGSSSPLHPDFGSGTYNGGPIGIPYIPVPGTQTKYPATFL